jgi:hypothetical protein
MFFRLATLALAAATALPASAAPFEIVNPGEPMIVLPAFKDLGPSRLSTIEWCSELVGKAYDELITDSDFEGYEECLKEHT